ncbi:hypothetical protein MJN47_32015, partial [Salmonella enterica subsp. enterica serovar Lubbock]|nr:hypothetical protein [Salmonella enterica subsp. enterica serovar Lubbock]
ILRAQVSLAWVIGPPLAYALAMGFSFTVMYLSAAVAFIVCGVDANTNGQVVIRDSVINEGFNVAKPWADAVISKRPFAGNTGT